MAEIIRFVAEHGYLMLFAWVFVEQLGLPIPAVPMLLAVGAVAGLGGLNAWISLLVAVIAALAADTAWYCFGRRRGGSVLNLLCRISLEPDSCVRKTESLFDGHRTRTLLAAKFIPGLSTVVPPVAGVTGMSLPRFLLFDALGSLLWAGTFIGVGLIFSPQLELIAFVAGRLGAGLVILLLMGFAAYIAAKYRERLAFIRSVAQDRITPGELMEKLDDGKPVFIVDLRHSLDVLPDPRTLPGALRMSPEDLESRHNEIPRDRDIILYCT